MLDPAYIRNHPELVRRKLTQRHAPVPLEAVVDLDRQRRQLLQEAEQLKHHRNRNNEAITALKKAGEDAAGKIAEMKELSLRIKQLDERLRSCEEHLKGLQLALPNLPDDSVPVGADASENVEIRVHGQKPGFDFEPRSHWDLGPSLGILDLERAAKIAGARFNLYAGAGARLERALINFMLDVHTGIRLPGSVAALYANSASLTGTGQLPKFSGDLFKVEGTDYWLVPTAEVPVTNIFARETLQAAQLPIRLTAYTPCFRSEAGAHGKDTRGLIRQHQFNKVELVNFTRPEDSYAELENLTRSAEEILRRLQLHYRVVTLCTGDLGFAAAKTYDLEVWLPGQQAYREISSCSNFEDFQARRANIRFRRDRGVKPEFVHTLNGSGLAVGRTWVALVENHQQSDGSVLIPPALRPYLNGLERIAPGQPGLG